jgi:hypothetical protein
MQNFVDNSLPTIKAAWLNLVDAWLITGVKTSNGAIPLVLPSSQLQLTDTVNSYSSADIRNASTGDAASSDFVATADNGTATTNYVDFGINGSGYAQASWTVNGAGDGYVYASSGHMALGTAAAKRLDFFTGGTLAANVAMSIDGAGNFSFRDKGQVNGALGNIPMIALQQFGGL